MDLYEENLKASVTPAISFSYFWARKQQHSWTQYGQSPAVFFPFEHGKCLQGILVLQIQSFTNFVKERNIMVSKCSRAFSSLLQ